MADAVDILRSKVSVPSELRSRQWAALPVWVRERAFFMASVSRAEILDGFRAQVDKVASGELSGAEARRELRGVLAKTGYTPLPGQEGTIKDLNTQRRQNVALETNVAQVQGFGRWARQQAALDSYPAQRLVRLRESLVPRDWRSRWATALAVCGLRAGASGPAEMVALVNHPIWESLSQFGTPYPPFDFNSGMGIEPVERDEAEALGLLPGEDADSEHAAMMEPQDRGLNATLEASPAVRAETMRSALAERLQGFAEWDKDRLVFTDPNGTRPYSAERVAEVITQPLPNGFPQLQAEAVDAWANVPAKIKEKGGTDVAEDLIRLMTRTEPLSPDVPLARGEGFKTRGEMQDRVNHILDNQGFVSNGVAMSFSRDPELASSIANLSGPHRLVLHADRHYTAREISPAVSKISPDHAGEQEALFMHGRQFRLTREPWIENTPQGPIWHFATEEIRQ